MLPSNKVWLPATSAFCTRDKVASSNMGLSASCSWRWNVIWATLAAFSARGVSGPAAEAFASVCESFPHFKLYLQLPTSEGKPALQAHLGSAAPWWLPAAGNKDSQSCVSLPSSSIIWQKAPCCPSWQEPAAGGEHPSGKLDTFYFCMLDVVPADLFSQFNISVHWSTHCFSARARRFRPTGLQVNLV